MPVFVAPVPHGGLLIPGTIDLTRRPIVKLPNGAIATVDSISFHIARGELGVKRPGGAELLIPQVVGNRVVSARAAWSHFMQTGQHLGVFDTIAHCNAYAVRLHKWQAVYYRNLIKSGKRKVGSRG